MKIKKVSFTKTVYQSIYLGALEEEPVTRKKQKTNEKRKQVQ